MLEFLEVMSRFVANYCMLTGHQVKIDKAQLREVFQEMDRRGDGTVDFAEY